MKVSQSFSAFSEALPFLLAVALWPSAVSGDAPNVTHLVPAGAQRGTQSTVSCKGKLSWPLKIWAPGVEAVALDEESKFTVSIPADFPSDRVWLRFYNDEGRYFANTFSRWCATRIE